jgi:hypothetical protein
MEAEVSFAGWVDKLNRQAQPFLIRPKDRVKKWTLRFIGKQKEMP